MRIARTFRATAAALVAAAGLSSAPAQAADGCTVMLCMAGNWRSIAMCVPVVREALRDMLRGRFPTCDTGDGGTAFANVTQATCPPMYQVYVGEGSDYGGCRYPMVVNMTVSNRPWADVYVTYDGQTSTRYYPPALEMLQPDQIDPTYDRDWRAAFGG